MAKRKRSAPTYSLEGFQEEFWCPEVLRLTFEAQQCARDLGLTLDDVVFVIQVMSAEHFVKTMPSTKRAGAWQDVYRVPFADESIDVELYVKLSLDDLGRLVVSFKEW